MGKSNKQTVGYRYYLGMHMVLCHGPIDYIQWIKVGDRLAWEGVNVGTDGAIIHAPTLFGGEDREGGVDGAVGFPMGRPDQGQFPYLVQQCGSDVPAYRGVVSAIPISCYVGNNPYLKNWSFRGQRIHLRQDGIEQWYDAKAAIPAGDLTTSSFLFKASDVSWNYLVTTLSDGTDYSGVSYNDSSWAKSPTPFGDIIGFSYPTADFSSSPAVYVPGGTGKRVWIRYHLGLTWIPPSLTLTVLHDDDFRLYFNGTLVCTLPGYATSTVTVPTSALVLGDNVIAAVTSDSAAGKTWMDFHMSSDEEVSGPDMNPAHIIRECLTDPDWGMGYQDADIDDVSFMAAADTLYNERLGISLLWDTQQKLEDFIGTIIQHIDGALYVSRKTGKFVLKLIRNDYDVSTLITLDESNISKVSNPSKPAFADLVNSVTVQYKDSNFGTTIGDKDGSVTVTDPALVQMQGQPINTTIQYPGISNGRNASMLAQRDLRSLSMSFLSCTIYADRTAKDLNIGDTFKFSWARWNVSNKVMRVTGIAFGDGKSNVVRVTCTEDVFQTPTVAVIKTPVSEWVDPSQPPDPSTIHAAIEAPYYQLVQQYGQGTVDSTLTTHPEAGYVTAMSGRAANGIAARVWCDDGSGYADKAPLDFCATALVTADVGVVDTVIHYGSDVDLSIVATGTYAQLGSELMRVDAIDTTAQTITVGRGVLDTVPMTHSNGDRLYFWDIYNGMDQTEYTSGESISVKIVPFSGAGVVNLASAAADTVVLNQRAFRPYPPGNLRINGDSYLTGPYNADLTISWSHRNRLLETGGNLYDYTYGDIGPEAGTAYRLRGYVDGVLVHTEEPITGNSTVWNPGESGTVKVEVHAKRDGLYSLLAPAHEFLYVATWIRVTEAGEYRYTEDGAIRVRTTEDF